MTFHEAQEILGGGFVGAYPTRDGKAMALFDEDGLVKRLPRNEVASRVFGAELVGPVIFLSHEAFDEMMDDGESDEEENE